MRLEAILSEATKNVRGGTSRFALLAVTFAFVVGGVAIVEALTVTGLIDTANDFRVAGATVETVTATEGIDGRVCDALSDVAGVVASGALRNDDSSIELPALPNTPIPLIKVSPGLVRLLGSDLSSDPGILVSRAVAETLGVGPGDVVRSAGGDVTVTDVFDYPADGRENSLEFSALSVTSPREIFDQCWIESASTQAETAGLARMAIRADSPAGLEVTSRQLNPTLGTEFNGINAFVNRYSQWAAPVAFVAMMIVGVIAIRLRRLEIASALHAGVSRGAQTFQLCLETLAWLVTGAILLSPVVVFVHLTTEAAGDASALIVGFGAIVASGALGSLVGTLVSTATIRPDKLFEFFKNR